MQSAFSCPRCENAILKGCNTALVFCMGFCTKDAGAHAVNPVFRKLCEGALSRSMLTCYAAQGPSACVTWSQGQCCASPCHISTPSSLPHYFLFYGHWKSLHATSSGSLTLLLSFCHPTAAKQSVLEDSQCYVPVPTCSRPSCTICWLKCPSL